MISGFSFFCDPHSIRLTCVFSVDSCFYFFKSSSFCLVNFLFFSLMTLIMCECVCLSVCFFLVCFPFFFATDLCSFYCTSEQHALSHTRESRSLLLCFCLFFSSLSLAFISLLFSLSFFAKKKTSIKVYKMVTRNDCFLTDWMIQKFAPQLSTKEKYLYNDKKRNKEKVLFRLNNLIFYFIKYILRHEKFSNEYLVCIDSSAFTEKIYVNNYD
jgi:hypothetical protein